MISGVPEHQRSTHTNYLINLLKSALRIFSQQRGLHYTELFIFVNPMLQLRDNIEPTVKLPRCYGRRALYSAFLLRQEPAAINLQPAFDLPHPLGERRALYVAFSLRQDRAASNLQPFFDSPHLLGERRAFYATSGFRQPLFHPSLSATTSSQTTKRLRIIRGVFRRSTEILNLFYADRTGLSVKHLGPLHPVIAGSRGQNAACRPAAPGSVRA